MKKKLDKRKLIKKMDVLFSKIVRSSGKCAHCGKTENLQCSHVVSRKYLNTRWDIENALPLCYKCHIHWMHKEPHEYVAWFNKKYGSDKYETLRRRAEELRVDKLDYEEIYLLLKFTSIVKDSVITEPFIKYEDGTDSPWKESQLPVIGELKCVN